MSCKSKKTREKIEHLLVKTCKNVRYLRTIICLFFAIVSLVGITLPAYAMSDPLDQWYSYTPTSANLNGVCYGNNIFVVVGNGGTILTSPDGVNWTARSSGTNQNLHGVNYLNNIFVAVGSFGLILTSPDGVNWATRHQSGSDRAYTLTGVSYGNNIFVAVGNRGMGVTSADGINWTPKEISGTNDFDGITYSNELHTFVIVGSGNTMINSGNAIIKSSLDGLTWTNRHVSPGAPRVVCYGAGKFVAVGGDIFFTSSNGENWSSYTGYWMDGICYGNDTFVGVDGIGRIFTSLDGLHFHIKAWTRENLNAIGFGKNTFIVVGENGRIFRSATPLPRGEIEVPISGATISGISTVSGWYLDGNGVQKIEILVDGVVQGEAVYGDSRPDVGATFQEYNNNNAGYHYDLNTSLLTSGDHTLSIRETANNGTTNTLGPISITISDTQGPTADSITNSGSPTGQKTFGVYANNVVDAGSGVDKVLFPTWTTNNDKDDLIWYAGVYNQANNRWEVNIDAANHNSEAGEYNIHAYGYDKAGNATWLGGTTVVVEATADTQGPTADSITNSGSPTGQKTFGVYANNVVDAGSGVDKVLFPTWTTNNDKDDLIWYAGVYNQANNRWEVNIDAANHNSEAGEYNIHAYGYDKAGNATWLGGTTVVVEATADTQGPTADSITNSGSPTGQKTFSVYANNVVDAGSGVDKVLFPTWTTNNDKDDLIWYAGVYNQANNRWEVNIDAANHNSEAGEYNIHAYGYDKAGNATWLGGTTVVVEATADTQGPTADSITNSGSPTGQKTFSVYANNVVDAGSGVDKVLFPTWTTNNDKDDLIWYAGVYNQANNRWEVNIDAANHNSEAGEYNIHAYGYDKAGNATWLGGTTVVVEATADTQGPTADSITNSGSPTGQKTFSVYANNVVDAGSGVDKVLFPTWTTNNDKDDLIWYAGVYNQANNRWEVNIDAANHNSEAGEYNIHAYGYDKAGNATWLGGTTVVVEATADTQGPTADSITNSGSPTGQKTFSVYANNVVDAGSGVDKVLFPTWTTNNDKDDLIWYAGVYNQANNRWEVNIDAANHNSEAGEYNIHAYGYDKAGNATWLGGTTVVVEATADTQGPTADSLEATADTQGPTADSLEATADTQGPTADSLEATEDTQGSPADSLEATEDTQGSPADSLEATEDTQGSPADSLEVTVDTQGPTT